ncbi:MAG: L,D-transpeptidase, partial [Clostridia bacterium]|nr:L,D-transpeptidase [Clostridia bacterium]
PAPTPRPRMTPGPDRQLSAFPDPHDKCFWNMDIDNLDPENPEDWPIIWEIMMQPITVLNVDPKAHVYPLNEPNADPKDYSNITGQLHGATQGVHVLENLSGGWSRIEAYSNDGFNAPRSFIRGFNSKLIHGYVRTNQLKTVRPNQDIALLIDKLRQRMYVFEKGEMTGQLRISTGLATKTQPYAETPAGEFLADSWVGKFMNGNMYCDMAIRINGGILIHEVPYVIRDNGENNWASFEQFLGRKASMGCIRVPRDTNEQGMNMRWLWRNLQRQSKVLIWDDLGRGLPPPDPDLPVFYNPDGGRNYHLNQQCPGVKNRFLPLTGLVYAELFGPPFDSLTPCTTCDPPPRHEDEYYHYEVPEEIHGVAEESEEPDDEP